MLRYTGCMDESQTKDKHIVRRYQRCLMAFGAGFIPGAITFGYAMFHDLTHHQFDSDTQVVMAVAESALKAGILFGGITLAAYVAIALLNFYRNRLLK